MLGPVERNLPSRNGIEPSLSSDGESGIVSTSLRPLVCGGERTRNVTLSEGDTRTRSATMLSGPGVSGSRAISCTLTGSRFWKSSAIAARSVLLLVLCWMSSTLSRWLVAAGTWLATWSQHAALATRRRASSRSSSTQPNVVASSIRRSFAGWLRALFVVHPSNLARLRSGLTGSSGPTDVTTFDPTDPMRPVMVRYVNESDSGARRQDLGRSIAIMCANSSHANPVFRRGTAWLTRTLRASTPVARLADRLRSFHFVEAVAGWGSVRDVEGMFASTVRR